MKQKQSFRLTTMVVACGIALTGCSFTGSVTPDADGNGITLNLNQNNQSFTDAKSKFTALNVAGVTSSVNTAKNVSDVANINAAKSAYDAANQINADGQYASADQKAKARDAAKQYVTAAQERLHGINAATATAQKALETANKAKAEADMMATAARSDAEKAEAQRAQAAAENLAKLASDVLKQYDDTERRVAQEVLAAAQAAQQKVTDTQVAGGGRGTGTGGGTGTGTGGGNTDTGTGGGTGNDTEGSVAQAEKDAKVKITAKNRDGQDQEYEVDVLNPEAKVDPYSGEVKTPNLKRYQRNGVEALHSADMLDNARYGAVYVKPLGGEAASKLFVQGKTTDVASMPKSGKATYKGTGLHFGDGQTAYENGERVSKNVGDISFSDGGQEERPVAKLTKVSAEVDFEKSQDNISVNIANHTDRPGSVSEAAGVSNKNNLPEGGLNYVGTIKGSSFEGRGRDSTNGMMEGNFFGDNAVELAGLYRNSDNTSGVFGAKQDSSTASTTPPAGNPVNPTDPVKKPTDPVNPTDPVKPTDPVNPTDPVKPTDPVNPTDPVKPTDPVNPTDPVKPTDPMNPTDPAKVTPTNTLKASTATTYTIPQGYEKDSNTTLSPVEQDLSKVKVVVVNGVAIALTSNTPFVKTGYDNLGAPTTTADGKPFFTTDNSTYIGSTVLDNVVYGVVKVGEEYHLFTQGDLTAEMPTSGIAKYSGNVLHYNYSGVEGSKERLGSTLLNPNSYAKTSGSFNATVDFGSNKVSNLEINTDTGRWGLGTVQFTDLPIQGSKFGGAGKGSRDSNATVEGGFYGENAAEVSGKYEGFDGSDKHLGVFGGKKEQ